jgi:serine/threonine-protein kinase
MTESLIAGRYRLDSLLGRGGMSEVWCATDIELGRRVALKLLAPKQDIARFEREARTFAALAHPNVTQLYDYGQAEGRPFMVLEYLPGGTLEQRLRDGRLRDELTWVIATDIAAGLAHAHARGVVHRDLKPSNILFDEEGRAKLADFGIASTAAAGSTLTEVGTVLGTAAYISPEQAGGLPATPASDVYSFGVLLYRMLTGRLPFESLDPATLVVQHRDATPPSVHHARTDAPPALAGIADAALAKDPAFRPADGSALLDALDGGAVEAAPAVATAETMPTTKLPAPPPPPPRRRTFGSAFALAVLLLLALAGGVLAYEVTRPPADAPARLTPPSTSTASSTPPTTGAPTTGAPTTRPTSSTPASSSTSVTTSTTTSTTVPTTTRRRTTTRATTTIRVTTLPLTTTVPPPPTTDTTTPPTTTDTTPTTAAPTT